MHKLKLTIITLAAALLGAAPLAAVPAAYAQDTGSNRQAVCEGLNNVGSGCSDNGIEVTNLVRSIINLFSWVVGVVSVIMIIIGGFRYVISNGDATKITTAKNTIMYAIIGLLIVAFAQVIVRFVMTRATTG